MPDTPRGDAPARPGLAIERCPHCQEAIPTVSGLSKREDLARSFMQTLLAIAASSEDEQTGKDLALEAVAYADDLLQVCATIQETA